jgi:hypothetical protein
VTFWELELIAIIDGLRDLLVLKRLGSTVSFFLSLILSFFVRSFLPSSVVFNILIFNLFLICIVGVESKLGPLGTSATHWPIVPAPADCEDGEFGGMNGRGLRELESFLEAKCHSTSQ